MIYNIYKGEIMRKLSLNTWLGGRIFEVERVFYVCELNKDTSVWPHIQTHNHLWVLPCDVINQYKKTGMVSSSSSLSNLMQRIFVASLLLKYSGGRLSLILIISRIHKKKEENFFNPNICNLKNDDPQTRQNLKTFYDEFSPS